jgi:hypothetical protein
MTSRSALQPTSSGTAERSTRTVYWPSRLLMDMRSARKGRYTATPRARSELAHILEHDLLRLRRPSVAIAELHVTFVGSWGPEQSALPGASNLEFQGRAAK